MGSGEEPGLILERMGRGRRRLPSLRPRIPSGCGIEVFRLVRDQEVGGSNPPSPTKGMVYDASASASCEGRLP